MSFEVHAVSSDQELRAAAVDAQNFLCKKGFCLDSLPPLELRARDGFLGYAHVDSAQSLVSISPDLNAADTRLVLVHEFTHVYRARFNQNEEAWLIEGVAKLMEYQYSNVWPVSYIERLKNNPQFLFSADRSEATGNLYSSDGAGYFSSFFLVLYLYNHFGQDKLILDLLQSRASGWESVVESINRLIETQDLKVSQDLVSREQILRLFAIGAWMNDPFLAKYSLMHLDARFEPFRHLQGIKFDQVTPASRGVLKIQYSLTYEASAQASEVHSITSYTPFSIKRAEPNDQAKVFVYLFF